MTRSEFQTIAGYEVEDRIYTEVIEPMYMATDLSKHDFVKTLTRKCFEKKQEKRYNIKKMHVCNRAGYSRTPNGCYYFIEYVNLIDIDIKTGKYIVEALPDNVLHDLSRTNDLNYSTSYDIHYLDCVDSKKKPIEIR